MICYYSFEENTVADKAIGSPDHPWDPKEKFPDGTLGGFAEKPVFQNSLPNVLPERSRTNWDSKPLSTVVDFKKLAVVQSDYDNTGFSGRK